MGVHDPRGTWIYFSRRFDGRTVPTSYDTTLDAHCEREDLACTIRNAVSDNLLIERNGNGQIELICNVITATHVRYITNDRERCVTTAWQSRARSTIIGSARHAL